MLILREYSSSHLDPESKRGPKRTDVVFTIDLTSADGLFSAKRFRIDHRDVVLVTESPVTKTQTIFALFGSAFGVVRGVQSVTN